MNSNLRDGIELLKHLFFLVVIFFLISLISDPLEKLIRLSPEDRVLMKEGIEKIDSIISECKQINRRFTPQKTYQYWHEDIESYGGNWYQRKKNHPIIKVYFNEEPGHSYSGYYCEVGMNWSRYEFYRSESEEIGEDGTGKMYYQSFRYYMCDDYSEDVPHCT